MTWIKIKKIQRSNINKNCLVYFDFQGNEEFAIISKRVLQYLKIKSINKNNELFVIKSFNNTGSQVFLVKNVR